MKMHRIGLAMALTGALYACGDDSDGNGVPNTQTGQNPATGIDAAVRDSGPSTGSAAPGDASVAIGKDAAVPPPVDAGATQADAAAPHRDASTSPADSGTGPRADSGVVVMNPPTGGDAGAGPSLLTSAACTSCMMTQCVASKWPNADVSWAKCSDPYDGSETALAGKGMGKPRSQLCTDLLSCVQSTGCGNPLVTAVGASGDGDSTPTGGLACFCGSISQNACIMGPDIATLKGACRDQYAAAAEADNTATTIQNDADPTLPVGRALNTVRCQQELCADECYNPCSDQADGVSCAGLLIGTGTAGTCQAHKCVPYPVRFTPT